VTWRDYFTDVADDGNCQMHCVWLGLRTLLGYYPNLSIASDLEIPGDPVEFRRRCFDKMRKDQVYLGELYNTFKA